MAEKLPGAIVLLASCLLTHSPAYAGNECVITPIANYDRSPTVLEHGAGNGGQPDRHFALHGQLLLGEESLYLYHLPLFMVDPQSHPHAFQIVLSVGISQVAANAVASDRRQSGTSLYTVKPEPFEQTRLLPDANGARQLGNLIADVHRGHFERPPSPVVVAAVDMDIGEVVYFREFQPSARRATGLEYLLFGRDDQYFLAHVLTAPPDFDQVLAVRIATPPSGLPARGAMRLRLEDRANRPPDRLVEKEHLDCAFDGNDEQQTVSIDVVTEIYCETGELAQEGFAPSRGCDDAAD